MTRERGGRSRIQLRKHLKWSYRCGHFNTAVLVSAHAHYVAINEGVANWRISYEWELGCRQPGYDNSVADGACQGYLPLTQSVSASTDQYTPAEWRSNSIQRDLPMHSGKSQCRRVL
jgi:hypothetical protein